MGSCASVYRKRDSSGNYRASIVHSESGKLPDSMLSTSEKVKAENVNGGDDQRVNSLVCRSQVSPLDSFTDHGSKEQAFFDSQPWLESDCEDDFYSVNGDFTPSRGSTPLHSSMTGTPLSVTMSPRINRALPEGRPPTYHEANPTSQGSTPLFKSVVSSSQNPWGSATCSPPTDKKKKRLSDLFRESIRENPLYESHHQNEAEAARQNSQTKSGDSSPHISGASSGQRTPAMSKSLEKKHLRSSQCCFPRLPSGRVLKKTAVAAPPAIAVDA